MKTKRFNIKKFALAILLLIVLIIGLAIAFLIFNLTSVSSKEEYVSYQVKEGSSTYEVINNLESDGLIRSSFTTKIYLKLFNNDVLIKTGTYRLSPHLSTKETIKIFEEELYENAEEKKLTFKEGFSIPKMIQLLENQTSIKKSNVLNALNDTDYINSLIDKYWFLTNDILNTNSYYPLEGYLFPNTYNFYYDASIKDIFKKMLDETNRVLTKYKSQIEKNKYSVHEIITLSSIIQVEGTNTETLKKVSSVLHNRLDDKWLLGCCTTAYYGAKLIQGQDEFGNSQALENPYNTYLVEGFPVGPISNPGENALNAALNPADTNYYYFVSDSSLNLYFSRTQKEHDQTIYTLKNKGIWSGS